MILLDWLYAIDDRIKNRKALKRRIKELHTAWAYEYNSVADYTTTREFLQDLKVN